MPGCQAGVLTTVYGHRIAGTILSSRAGGRGEAEFVRTGFDGLVTLAPMHAAALDIRVW